MKSEEWFNKVEQDSIIFSTFGHSQIVGIIKNVIHSILEMGLNLVLFFASKGIII